MELPNLFTKSIKPRVTRSSTACSKICWIPEMWYDHEGQSSSKAPWYSSVLELLPPGWWCRFQQTHTKTASSCHFVWQLLLPMTQFQQLTDGTWSTPFWRKQSLASLFWFSPSHGSFFQAPYKALEPIYYIKSHKWHLKRGKSQGLPELYYHFYCYWLFNIFYIGSIKAKMLINTCERWRNSINMAVGLLLGLEFLGNRDSV